MSAQPNESTPEPIKSAAASIGTAVTAGISLLGVAVTLGVMSTEQADALTVAGTELAQQLPAIAAAISGVVGIVSGIVASFATAWHARKKTVPVDSDVFTVAPNPAVGPLDQG